MLFTARTLDGLADGSVSVTYRRWATVRPKVGSRFATRAGVVEVTEIGVVEPDALTDADARAAGFADRTALLRWIEAKKRLPGDARRDGASRLYRVGLALAGPDPRVALRAEADMDSASLADLRKRLDRMDAAAEAPWTRPVLRQIQRQPGVVSTVLAEEAGQERARFKSRVRRLKALGLTESLEVGYRLSPRGQAFLTSDGPDHADI